MAGDTDNPRIWLGADVYVAPVGTTAPVDTATAWGVGWEALGLLSEDGMTQARTQDETDYYDWSGKLIRNTRSKFKRTFTVTALEDNDVIFDLSNPGSTATTATGITTRTVKVPTPDPRAFGFELVDGGVTKRIIVPRGEVTSVADTPYTPTGISTTELTISVYPNASGEFFIEITDDDQATAV